MPFDICDIQQHDSELLKLLTYNLPDMLWVKDINGIYMYANQAICDNLLIAKDTDEPIGKNDIFFAKREREAHKENPEWHTFGELCFNSDQIVIDNNKAMKFEEYGNVKGKMLYLEVFKAPFYDKDGNIIGTVGAGRDITELKMTQLRLEESLKIMDVQKQQLEAFNNKLEKRVQEEVQKQKSQELLMIHQSRQAAMGEMLESIAHQWRQPLNIIGIASANIETQLNIGKFNKEEVLDKMDIIAKNIEYMSDTIDDFRNFLDPNRKTINFHPKKSVQDVFTILEAQLKTNNIKYTMNMECPLLFNGVENEFKQVMIILINNAIDAIKLQITKGKIKTGEISINFACDKTCGIIEIEDIGGGGIKEKNINRIFEPYFTTKKEAYGTGIGLYIAKNIIETRMGGKLWVKNTKKGSCFTIEAPIIGG